MTSDLLLCVRHVRNRIIIFAIFLTFNALALLQISGSIAIAAPRQESFSFRAQQSVYIVAVRGNLGDPSLSQLDLASEKEIRDGFKKRGIFKIAPSLSNADFVLLCITEHRENVKAKVLLNVLSIALKPEDFQANRADLIKLRDLALWQNTRSAKARVKLKSVVEDFHDFAVKD
jgi:hypothetical protein